MTEAQLRKLVDTWAGRLGLDRYRLSVQMGGLDDATSYAEVSRSVYQRGVIHFAPWLLDGHATPDDVLGIELTPDFIETIVVHELLHLWTRDLRAIVRDDCDGLVHPDAYRQLDLAAMRAEEQLVDGLAEALVKAWPA